MPRFAVSYIDWFDHDLSTKIVVASDWRAALELHPKIAGTELEGETLEEVKTCAFDCDCMIEVVEIEEPKP